MFCATKADIDCMYAEDTSIINAQSFSATPTPAEATTPNVLTMAMITRNEIFTSRSWRAIGAPRQTILPIRRPSKRMSFFDKANGNSRFRMIKIDNNTLIACAKIVAKAAPATPIWNPATNSTSPTIFSTQAIATVINGILESPIPRKILPRTLYATIKTVPAEQICT